MFDFGAGWGSFVRYAMIGVFAFGIALLASQHLQQVAGILPFLLLLACPLMHFFGHSHRHGHHHHEQQLTTKEPTHGH